MNLYKYDIPLSIVVQVHLYGYRYGEEYSMHYGIQQKFCMCTQLARNGIQNCIHTEGCAFPSLFPCITHGSSSFETIVWCLFKGRRSTVIIRTLVIESNIFSDQCYELLCFILRDFADLRYGWITCASPPTRKNGEKRLKKWRKWEKRPSVNTCSTA